MPPSTKRNALVLSLAEKNFASLLPRAQVKKCLRPILPDNATPLDSKKPPSTKRNALVLSLAEKNPASLFPRAHVARMLAANIA